MSNRAFRENSEFLAYLMSGGRVKMYTGKLQADGSVTTTGAPTNKAWVRDSETVRGQVAVWGTALVPNVPVWVRDGPDGRYIESVVWEEGTVRFGAALSSLVQPPPNAEVTGGNIPGLALVPGRPRPSTLGFPYLHVDGFHYNGGFWRGGDLDVTVQGGLDQTADDADITAYIPATTGHVGWVAVYLDPADDALHFVAGTTQAGAVSVLDEANIQNITLPDGVYPLGAVALTNGMTDWGSNLRLVDYRRHIDSNTAALGNVTLTPGSLTRNTVQPSGDFIALVIKNNASQTVAPFQHQSSAGAILASLDVSGNLLAQRLALGGAAISTANVVNLDTSLGNIAATSRGVNSLVLTTLSANNANVLIGGSFSTQVDQNGFNFTAPVGARGFAASVNASGASGTVTGMAALQTTVLNTGAGTVTNAYAINIPAAANSGGGTIGTVYGINIADQTVGTANYALVTNAGLVVFNEGGANADLRIEGDTDANLLFTDASTDRVGIGLATPTTKLSVLLSDGGASTVAGLVTLAHNGGTPAAGFGSSIAMLLESSTSTNQDAALIEFLWAVATHASRSADLVLSAYYTTSKREGLRIRGGASATEISFFGGTPVTKPTALTAALTAITHTAPGTPDYAIQNLTNAGGFGFVTADEGNTVLSVVARLQTRVNELETKLQSLSLLA